MLVKHAKKQSFSVELIIIFCEALNIFTKMSVAEFVKNSIGDSLQITQHKVCRFGESDLWKFIPFLYATCKERKETVGSKSVHAYGHPPTPSPLSHPTHMQELVKLLKVRPGGRRWEGSRLQPPGRVYNSCSEHSSTLSDNSNRTHLNESDENSLPPKGEILENLVSWFERQCLDA